MDDFTLDVLKEPASLEEVLEYNPTKTLIFGGETEVYKSVGFYYSFPMSDNVEDVIKEYTQKLEAVGLVACYETHGAMYHEEVLRSNREEVGNANVALLTLLTSLDKRDFKAVEEVLKYNFDTLISAAKDLQSVYTTLDNDKTWEIKAIQAKQKYKELVIKYNEAVQELTELRKTSGTGRELVMLKEEFNELNTKYAEATNQLAEAQASMKSMHTHAEFEALQEKLEIAEEQLKNAQHKNQETSLFEDKPDRNKDELIAVLKKQLAEAQQSNGANYDEALPIITSALHLNASNIITLKEIKRAPYMVSLLKWLMMAAVSKRAVQLKIRTLIIVYDNLTDLNKVKYQKASFAINEAPAPGTPVVVTSNLSQTFLRNVLSISSYNKVIIVDRLGAFKLVTERTDSKNYYLIDSPSDIEDYKLDAKKCIAYYNSNGICAADILPSGDLATQDKRNRVYGFTQNVNFKKLFD